FEYKAGRSIDLWMDKHPPDDTVTRGYYHAAGTPPYAPDTFGTRGCRSTAGRTTLARDITGISRCRRNTRIAAALPECRSIAAYRTLQHDTTAKDDAYTTPQLMIHETPQKSMPPPTTVCRTIPATGSTITTAAATSHTDAPQYRLRRNVTRSAK
ncbi:15333_t:CDS:2, partial [Acaulospora morrowiae]